MTKKINEKYLGTVNVPIYQTSTVLFDSLKELEEASNHYGRAGTETNFALEREIAELENAYKAIVVPSGLASISAALLSLVKKGDNILVFDGVYSPTKILCDTMLKKFGITTTYFKDEKELEDLIQDNTKVIFLEFPASLTYEILNIERIVRLAKQKNILTIADSTWSAGVLAKVLDFDIDVSVQSGSKYFSGHADILFGSIAVQSEEIYKRIWTGYYQVGFHTSPQDCYLALRGLKTLKVRLEKHAANALEIAKFLESNSLIERVIYPGLDSFKDKSLYQKYFSGSNGLLSFTFKKDVTIAKIRNFVDSLNIFKIGYSWGGFESLVMLYNNIPSKNYQAPLIRIHVGLEDIEELKIDLTNSLKNIK